MNDDFSTFYSDQIESELFTGGSNSGYNFTEFFLKNYTDFRPLVFEVLTF